VTINYRPGLASAKVIILRTQLGGLDHSIAAARYLGTDTILCAEKESARLSRSGTSAARNASGTLLDGLRRYGRHRC
jgi:hypothetical protein